MLNSTNHKSPGANRKNKDGGNGRQKYRAPWFTGPSIGSRSDFTMGSGRSIDGGTLTGRTISTGVAITIHRTSTPTLELPTTERVTTTPKNLETIFGAYSQDSYNQYEDEKEVQNESKVLYISSQSLINDTDISDEEELTDSKQKENDDTKVRLEINGDKPYYNNDNIEETNEMEMIVIARRIPAIMTKIPMSVLTAEPE
jgi:hypothetical protein